MNLQENSYWSVTYIYFLSAQLDKFSQAEHIQGTDIHIKETGCQASPGLLYCRPHSRVIASLTSQTTGDFMYFCNGFELYRNGIIQCVFFSGWFLKYVYKVYLYFLCNCSSFFSFPHSALACNIPFSEYIIINLFILSFMGSSKILQIELWTSWHFSLVNINVQGVI